jgi:beta-lactamase class A
MRKFLTFVALLIALLSIFPIYTRYKASAAPLAPGVRLGGLDLSQVKDRDEIARHLNRIYMEPIPVYFGDQQLVLEPEAVGFQVDVDQMLAEASQYMEGSVFMGIATRAALGLPQVERDIPVRYMMDADKLRAWLEEAAAAYNSEPQRPRALPPSERWIEVGAQEEVPPGFVGEALRDWTWTPGAPGYELDVEASIPLVIEALTDPAERSAELALTEIPAPRPSMADLERALDSYTSDFPGFASIYVHNFADEETAHVDDEVAFSGMSTLKIGIVTAIMHKIDGLPKDDPELQTVGQWIDFALGESNNYAANLLLKYLGDGDINAGTRYFTDVMRQLGFESTYMQSGYDTQVQLPQIPTPGNQQDDWDTDPDSNLQSTPEEMGVLLSAIYDCTQGEGLLLDAMPDKITPEECEYILFYMRHDEFQELLWGGLPRPEQAWFLHKHGFAFESHSDVGMAWGPNGPYVLSVFLFRRGWMDWETSNGAMRDISRITWNFFDLQRAYDEAEPPPPPDLIPPPGYVPVGDFVPAS